MYGDIYLLQFTSLKMCWIVVSLTTIPHLFVYGYALPLLFSAIMFRQFLKIKKTFFFKWTSKKNRIPYPQVGLCAELLYNLAGTHIRHTVESS